MSETSILDADLPYPRFSIAERDRRWGLVRELMGRGGLDAIIAMQPLYIGPSIPQELADAFEVQKRALEACYAELRPGVPFRRIIEVATGAGAGTPFNVRLIMHGRGLGDDAPFINQNRPDVDVELDMGAVEENCVFQVKPGVVLPEYGGCTWADSVVATPSGARRLGRQPVEIIHIPA